MRASWCIKIANNSTVGSATFQNIKRCKTDQLLIECTGNLWITRHAMPLSCESTVYLMEINPADPWFPAFGDWSYNSPAARQPAISQALYHCQQPSAIWPYHDNDVTVMPCCLAIQCFTDYQWNRCLVCYLKTNLLLIIRHAVIRIVSSMVV